MAVEPVGSVYFKKAPALLSSRPSVLTAVVGTVDATFVIERVSSNAAVLFERTMAELIGQSLLDLLAVDHVSACLAALADVSESQAASHLMVTLCSARRQSMEARASFFPLQPAPGLVFIFLPLARQAEAGLTVRESDIVTRLLDGDRVPAIAAKLFLSQSTVRNHLASVFLKRGVASQQELLDSLR